MKLLLDGIYKQTTTRERQRLKYWENGNLVLRPIRETHLGPIEVGSCWESPLWNFEKLYELSP